MSHMGLKNLEKIPPEYRGLIQDYFALLQQKLGDRLRSVCVFGSIAKGKPDPKSDIDILIVANGFPFDVLQRVKETSPILQKLKEKRSYKHLRELGRCALVSPVFLTPEEAEKHPPIMLDLVEEGISIYDDKFFLASVLESIRRRLRELNARRVYTTKGYYWVLKPDLKPGEVVEI